jgi:hypothetical protein
MFGMTPRFSAAGRDHEPSIRPELARRLVLEAAAVRALFPGRFRLKLGLWGRPAWTGCVPVEGRDFPLVVTYPPSYPGQPPLLETTAELPAHCPHVLGRGEGRTRLCWIAPHASLARRRWDPQRHTVAKVLRAAQRWGIAFLVWQTLGIWPVADAWET